ncbi:hypothetical protein CCR85_00990 [Rhodothalassium salexigens]|uniref:BCCT family transporter n=1 Tax=Rhodothalassium salexigens TaxID=1086 RepID=UPI001911640A|nr:BCCT family transporter [Rhodothalassium salexigens]MBK5910069.1 hypothetical protein [Rhodothalassium salexigens]MBK5921764.1 hypothetical protein [Rhodothalassium salexigens]
MRAWLERRGLFLAAVAAIAALVVFAIAQGSAAEAFFSDAQRRLAHATGWLQILIVNAVLGFLVWLALSRHAGRRLGGAEARPEFGLVDWFGMLFAAGMGIGLLFYSVAEPVQHYASVDEFLGGDRPTSARLAMEMTFLHWGLHPWGIYALVGLCLGFFHFNFGAPLAFDAPLREVMSAPRVRRWGWLVNLFAVLGTVVGIATSLGLGARQASAGIARLFGWQTSYELQLGVIVLVCGAALVSVLAGVGAGIRRFSVANLVMAVGLMLFVLVSGETLFVLKAFGEHLGSYLDNLLSLATWNETYTGTDWQSRWTIFYWSWWIAWSPFVGMFIARVSRGRTLREFILGVLLVPSLFNFLWMTVFGSNALYLDLFEGVALAEAVIAAPDESLYIFLDYLPLTGLAMGLAIVVIMIFFVTSADSGGLVVATLTSNGADPSWRQRAFWTLAVGVVAAVLLRAGGLSALQSATITAGLPFGLLVVTLMPALARALARTDPTAPGNQPLPVVAKLPGNRP